MATFLEKFKSDNREKYDQFCVDYAEEIESLGIYSNNLQDLKKNVEELYKNRDRYGKDRKEIIETLRGKLLNL